MYPFLVDTQSTIIINNTMNNFNDECSVSFEHVLKDINDSIELVRNEEITLSLGAYSYEDIDYKEIDRGLILKYLKSNRGVTTIGNLIAKSRANKLRVFQLLIELEQNCIIKVIKQDMFGAPIEVTLNSVPA